MNRDFKGVWIPKEIYLNEDLSWTEKILLIEIDSLDQGEGCWASNEHLSTFLNKSESQIANLISRLRKDGYLFDRSFDGRKRYISINSSLRKTVNQGYGKPEVRVTENRNENTPENDQNILISSHGIDKEKQPSNTSINTDEIAIPEKSGIVPTSLEGEEIPSFEEYLEELGVTSQYEGENGDGVSTEIYRDSSGKKISLATLQKNYRGKYRPKPYKARTEEFDATTEHFIRIVTAVLKTQYSVSPVVTKQTKKIISENLILKYPKDFIKAYASWFFSNEKIDLKFKVNFSAMSSASFINQFIAETGQSPE